MSSKREKIDIIKRINPTRIAEYQESVLNSSATKIQSIWRGHKVRSSIRPVTRPEISIEPPATDTIEHNDITQINNENKIERILERIKEKAKQHDSLSYTKSEIHQKCKELNDLMEKKMIRDKSRSYNPQLKQNFVMRTGYWLEACERLDESLSYSRSEEDPIVDDITRSAHIAHIKQASHGWWKTCPDLNKAKWNEPDIEFDAWIAEIESIPVTGGDRYF